MQTGSLANRIVEVPENQGVLIALSELVQNFDDHKAEVPHLVFLHGRTGMGKTKLVRWAIEEVQQLAPHAVIVQLAPSDLIACGETQGLLDAARRADLLVVEDFQHLPPSFVEAIIGVLDDRDAAERDTVVTANSGPKDLGHRGIVFPARLRSRLAAGLVIALEPLSVASRSKGFEHLTQGLEIDREVLSWLVQRLSSWRELEGAATQLKAMVNGGPLKLSSVHACFGHGRTISVEIVARRVADYFELNERRLKSPARARKILLARQISMYLARRLTKLPLARIGDYFGGRDHSTVLHACAQVERALARPSALTGAIRQLEAELA